jgi:hypothetical protein
MYTTLTFLDTAILTLAGFLASWTADIVLKKASDTTPLLAILASVSGVALSALSHKLADAYVDHPTRAFAKAKKIREGCPRLAATLRVIATEQTPLDQLMPSPPERLFQLAPRVSFIVFVLWFACLAYLTWPWRVFV